MTLSEVKPKNIEGNPIKLIGDEWMLICAGHKDNYNMMTAAWAGLGVLWSKPICFIFVRPSRYTYEFLEKQDNFSLNFFSKGEKVEKNYRKILNECGSKSGRNINKMKEIELSPIEKENTIYFKESSQVLLCKKIYFDDLDPKKFLETNIETNYNGKDYHRMYVGEIISVLKS